VTGFQILAATVILAVPAARAEAPDASPSTVKVTTSRGEHSLLVYAPPPGSRAENPLVLLISGEGGWRRFDTQLSQWMSSSGYWVGGVNAVDYFWEAQDDRQLLASDFRAFGGALASAAGQPADARLILCGFSFGADLAPWVAGAGGWSDRIGGMLMLGPDRKGSLEFRLLELLGFDQKDHVFSVAEALQSAAGIPALFIHGEKDSGSDAPALSSQSPPPRRMITIAGADHHFSGHEAELRAALDEGLRWIQDNAPRPPGP
jgi:type IV secretory pathway VirJ component